MSETELEKENLEKFSKKNISFLFIFYFKHMIWMGEYMLNNVQIDRCAG